MTDLRFADVCGNGESGNARYYPSLSAPSPHLNQFDTATLPLQSPTFSIASLFQPPESQLGLVLSHQQIDRQRLEALSQQQQQQQQQQHLSQPLQRPHQQQPAMTQLQANKPQYSDYEARLRSFEDPRWPRDCPVSASELAEAGFFYYGEIRGADKIYYDAVECFFCGKGVCRWVPGDNAWSEHQRISPSCLFVHDLNSKIKRGEIKLPSSCVTSSSGSQCSSTYASDDEGYSSQNSQDPLLCKVCLQKEISVTFLPCSHCISCIECAVAVKKCPVCREPIILSIRSYHA